jgi:hypothetical protein
MVVADQSPRPQNRSGKQALDTRVDISVTQVCPLDIP